MEIRQTKHQPRYTETKKGYLDALSLLSAPAVPNGLISQTLQSIRKKAHRAWLVRFSSWLFVCASSLAVSVYSVLAIFAELRSSGLLDYVELLWSDGATVLSDLSSQFIYALADALPVFSIMSMLLAFGFLLWSSKKSLAYFKSDLRSQTVSF